VKRPKKKGADTSYDKPAEELTDFEERIVRDAPRFDVQPLCALLREHGYGWDEILFESTQESTSRSVVRAVRFRQGPMFRSVVITVHLGLLGDNSPLPSYFLRVARDSPDPDRMFDFLRFFDHRLIDSLFASLHPDAALFGSGAMLQALLRMAVPGSVSTLHWLVQLHFPELGVRVARRPFENATSAHACRTGASVLDGTAILGYRYISDMVGFQVDLIAEDEADMRGHDHADIVIARLQRRLLPLLAPFRLPLIVRLVVLFHKSSATFDRQAARERPIDRQFLGYERLLGEEQPDVRNPRERPPRPPPRPIVAEKHTTVMFRGITGEDALRP
jgi:hypothetical protein